jgi:hypothetical protein
MEYLENDIRNILNKKTLQIAQVKNLMKQLLSGLKILKIKNKRNGLFTRELDTSQRHENFKFTFEVFLFFLKLFK